MSLYFFENVNTTLYIHFIFLYFIIYSFNIFILVFSLINITNLFFSNISFFFYLKPNLKIYFFIANLLLLGIPPVSGFILKLNLITIFFLKGKIISYAIFFCYIIISILLYTRLVKLSLPKKPSNIVFKTLCNSRNNFNYLFYLFISFLIFFNFFLIFFFKDFFIIFL